MRSMGAKANGRVSQIDVRDIAAVAVKTLTEGGHEEKTYTRAKNVTVKEFMSAFRVCLRA